MNCRRVEKLIPLYVEGDLASGIADRIASHLDQCGRCNWLADEYQESQSWLRSSETPGFGETVLTDLKAGVLRRIEEGSARQSLLTSLVQLWSRRQVFALSAALLIIFGVVLIYIYKADSSVSPRVVEKARQTPHHEVPPSIEPRETADTGTATGAGLSKRLHAKNPAKVQSRAGTPIISRQIVEAPIVSQAEPTEETFSSEPADAFVGIDEDAPEMLRIEIQTDDPNIRIIWFTPKKVESPNTNQ